MSQGVLKVRRAEDFLTSLVLFLTGYSTFETIKIFTLMSFFKYEGDVQSATNSSQVYHGRDGKTL